MATVDPGCPPETIDALNRMAAHAQAAAEKGELGWECEDCGSDNNWESGACWNCGLDRG